MIRNKTVSTPPLLLLPAGRFEHTEGTQVIDALAIQRIIRSAIERKRDMPVDYRHDTFAVPDAPPAGWLDHTSLIAKKDGIYGAIVWTDDARRHIRDKKFGYLSPVLSYDPERTRERELYIDGIIGLGLTNHPNIGTMPPLFNTIKLEEKMNELITRLVPLLELQDGADETTVLQKSAAQLEEWQSVRQTMTELKAALGLPKDATVQEVLALLAQSRPTADPQANIAPNAKEWASLKNEVARLAKRDVERQVDDAIHGGRLLPAQKEWAMKLAADDIDGFKKFLANSSPAVDLGGIIARNLGPSAKAPLDPVQEKVNELLGISRENFDKYNAY